MTKYFLMRLNFTVWKNEKFSLTEKIFRQINSLVTCLVKPLHSRNFWQKCVRENLRNFHTVSLYFTGLYDASELHSKLQNLIWRFFSWNKVQTNYSVSTLEMTIFREIISLVRVRFRSTFFSSWLTPDFDTLMGGNTGLLLPPIRVSNYEISEELRKVCLKGSYS